MSLDASEIKKIAHLARLGINADDIPEYSRNLSDILAFVEQLNAVDTTFVEQLNAVDTTGVEPLAHPLEATQRLRADTVTETDNRDNFQQVAPETESGLYLVPQVIE
jgi:aspartyl-tRNA(Asn)/glutamyl-tRNA(Gln) amidotransferase subunit C